LEVGSNVIVIGSPDEKGRIKAEVVRVVVNRMK